MGQVREACLGVGISCMVWGSGWIHCILCSLSRRKTLALTGDSFTSRLLS